MFLHCVEHEQGEHKTTLGLLFVMFEVRALDVEDAERKLRLGIGYHLPRALARDTKLGGDRGELPTVEVAVERSRIA